jgi:hypothetical protein
MYFLKYGKVPPGFGGFNRLVAEDSLLGFWKEGGGGRQGVDICFKDQYGFEAPNAFLVTFLASKSTSPGSKSCRIDSDINYLTHKYHPTELSKRDFQHTIKDSIHPYVHSSGKEELLENSPCDKGRISGGLRRILSKSLRSHAPG